LIGTNRDWLFTLGPPSGWVAVGAVARLMSVSKNKKNFSASMRAFSIACYWYAAFGFGLMKYFTKWRLLIQRASWPKPSHPA
jgi:hypothetical protein